MNTCTCNYKLTGVHIPCLLKISKHSETKSASTADSLTMCVKTVGVTDKTSKWQVKKRTPKVLSLFLLQNASVSQTKKDMNGS